MIDFDEAVRLVGEAARPMGVETVSLADAEGRALAGPVTARLASPRSDVSAMDGYAVREADVARFPARLALVGESFAGGKWRGAVGPGECVRIFTGAPVPAGADRVVMQENVRREGDVAVLDSHPGEARHIRRRGGDFAEGEALLGAGQLMHARAMVSAAAADVATVQVHARPQVTILSTGDELAPPGTAAARDGAVPDSVSFGVAALCRHWGGRVAECRRLRDDLDEMEAAAAGAVANSDLVVVTGGASVGEKDFAKAMFAPLGFEPVFSKVAIKPGKPVWLGRAGNALVIGLPGNPTSALVTGRLLLAPLLCGFVGRPAEQALHWRSARLAQRLERCGARETFHRARWSDRRVAPLSNQDSSAQKGLAVADLLVRQRAGASAQDRGDEVEVLDF